MKRYFIFLLLITLSGSIPAQTDSIQKKEKKIKGMYLDATAGVSFPVGKKYTSTDKSDETAGYAGTGYFIQVNFDYPGKNPVGIGLQYTYQHNPIPSSAENIEREGPYPNPLGPGAWSNNYLMIGPVLVMQVHKLLINARILIGAIVSSSPVFRYIDPVTQQATKNIAFGVGYGLNAGVGYSVSKKIALQMNVSYLGGGPKLSKEYQWQEWDSTTNTYVPQLNEISIKKVVSTLNIGAGAVFKF
jgi:opacity protein-like surface antigen